MQENVDSMNTAFDAEHQELVERREGEEWVDAGVSIGGSDIHEEEGQAEGRETGKGGVKVGDAGDVGDVDEALADAVGDESLQRPHAAMASGSDADADKDADAYAKGSVDADGADDEGGQVDMSQSTILDSRLRPTPVQGQRQSSSSAPRTSSGQAGGTAGRQSRPVASAANTGGGSGTATKSPGGQSTSGSGSGTARPSAFGQRTISGPGPFAQRTTGSASGPNVPTSTSTTGTGASRSTVDARRRMFEPSARPTGTGGSGNTKSTAQTQAKSPGAQGQDFQSGEKA